MSAAVQIRVVNGKIEASAADWLTSPKVTKACQQLKRDRFTPDANTYVVERPNGKLTGSEKDGPDRFDSRASAERFARELDADYDLPEGSHKVLVA
jgi:hypothetical protein